MMDYVQPQLRSRSFEYGSAAEASFRGQGLFNSCHALAATGTVSVVADGTGTILTDDGDTIRNVLRVHTVRTVSTVISPDSVIGEDAVCCLEVSESYEWFKGDETHPVMECTSVTSYRGDTILYVGKSAFRRVLPGLRDSNETEVSASREGNSYLGQQESHIRYHISSIGKVVLVDIHADTPTRGSFLLCDAAGVVYRSGVYMTDDTGGAQISVDCNGLRSGEYVMYFNTGDEVTARKVRL